MVALKYLIKFTAYFLYKVGLKTLLEKQERLRNNNRVLIQINSGIGDAILALPLLHELNAKGYEVHGVVNKDTETIANLCPDVRACYLIEYKIINILKIFKLIYVLNKLKFKYFLGALPSNRIRDAFFPVVLRIPVRTKHISPHKKKYRNYDFLFDRLIEVNKDKNNVVSNLMLLSLINEHFEDNEKKFRLLLSENLILDVKRKLKQIGYSEKKIIIGIHPGCKETWSFKRWPSEKFAELINLLSRQENLEVVLFGGNDETYLAERIIQRVTIKPLNLIGKLSLEETVCAISFCNIFISNDSALMHIATVFDIPVIGLFGGKTSEVLTGPYGVCHIVIKKENIKDIKVPEVLKEAEKLLDRIDNKSSQREKLNQIPH